MLLQSEQQTIANGDHTLAGLRFGKAEVPSINRSSDMKQTAFEIDVGPLKSQQLGYTHSRNSDEEYEGPIRFFQVIQELGNFGWLKGYLRLDRASVRKTNSGSRVRVAGLE
jgi:hypothetical protein